MQRSALEWRFVTCKEYLYPRVASERRDTVSVFQSVERVLRTLRTRANPQPEIILGELPYLVFDEIKDKTR